MATEVKGFTKFMEKAQESERATLQLEVQKLRRAEADWLQVLIHFLDHTYALHKAANTLDPSRCRRPGLCISNRLSRRRKEGRIVAFCRYFLGTIQRRAASGYGRFGQGARRCVVADTIATGYTYQGRIVRPALVQLQKEGVAPIAISGRARNRNGAKGSIRAHIGPGVRQSGVRSPWP
jgi:hypothetical protein